MRRTCSFIYIYIKFRSTAKEAVIFCYHVSVVALDEYGSARGFMAFLLHHS